MTVMNNQCMNYVEPFSLDEIGAARNAFLKYESVKQVQLLAVMPIEEAVAILHNCTIGHVQTLLRELDREGHDKLARHYAHQLGLIHSEAETAKDYLNTSVYEHVKQRIGWIISLALLGIVSGMIISLYEGTLSQLVLLEIYMPVIAAAGGNTGSQAATLVIRALATGEIQNRQWFSVLWKECRVALCLALAIAVVVMIRILCFSDPNTAGGFTLLHVGYAIAIALFIQVVLSTNLGGVLPIIARTFSLDPAVLVSPVLASIVDISGMWIYFNVVNHVLGLV